MSTLREQFAAYDKRPRVWLDSDGKEDWAFNFYDWFCKDSALENRAKKLMPAAKRFAKKMNIDLDTHYVFFKNNCPMNGPLRDDFRICEKETGDVYKPATWRAPYTKGKNAVRANIYDLTTVPDNANQCGGWLYHK